jgi:hypothetical protein
LAVFVYIVFYGKSSTEFVESLLFFLESGSAIGGFLDEKEDLREAVSEGICGNERFKRGFSGFGLRDLLEKGGGCEGLSRDVARFLVSEQAKVSI